MSNLYFIDGDDYYVEMLDADQAAAVLAGLKAESFCTADPERKELLAVQIREVSEWIGFLADEADAAAAEDAAIEHASALFADHLAGFS
ncbi:MAG: hypothetical protein O2892_07680 [Actinomycetota bacterium]|nr:hypothetical protein [Actinomycetota bacterium]MDA2948909.1 hypothetical protein [Actinomycetota bacterium]